MSGRSENRALRALEKEPSRGILRRRNSNKKTQAPALPARGYTTIQDVLNHIENTTLTPGQRKRYLNSLDISKFSGMRLTNDLGYQTLLEYKKGKKLPKNTRKLGKQLRKISNGTRKLSRGSRRSGNSRGSSRSRNSRGSRS